MKSELILGKDGDFRIDDNSVSRRHAKLTRDGDELYIEDLNSTNGTYVNGAPVKRKKIHSQDKIVLGTYELDLNKIDIPMSNAEFAAAFYELNGVYETHVNRKIALQTKSAARGAIMKLPMALPGVLMLGLSFMSSRGGEGDTVKAFTQFAGHLRFAGILLSVIGLVVGVYLGCREAAKMPQKMSELNEKFKLEYICPQCKRWFGETPWENLRLQGQCPNPTCKRKFEMDKS